MLYVVDLTSIIKLDQIFLHRTFLRRSRVICFVNPSMSDGRRLPPPRVVAWASWEEWQGAAKLVAPAILGIPGGESIPSSSSSSSSSHVAPWKASASACLSALNAFIVRGRAPLAVHATHQLLSLLLELSIDEQGDNSHAVGSGFIPSSEARQEGVRLALSMALQRLVNGLADSGQKGAFASSVFDVAARLGLPRSLVDLRHESAHGALPSLPLLRSAACGALRWLWGRYWAHQGSHTLRLLEAAPGTQHMQQQHRGTQSLDHAASTGSIMFSDNSLVFTAAHHPSVSASSISGGGMSVSGLSAFGTPQLISLYGRTVWEKVSSSITNAGSASNGGDGGGAASKPAVAARRRTPPAAAAISTSGTNGIGVNERVSEADWYALESISCGSSASAAKGKAGGKLGSKAKRGKPTDNAISPDLPRAAITHTAPLIVIDPVAAEAYKKAIAKAAAIVTSSAGAGGSAVSPTIALLSAVAAIPKPRPQQQQQPAPAATPSSSSSSDGDIGSVRNVASSASLSGSAASGLKRGRGLVGDDDQAQPLPAVNNSPAAAPDIEAAILSRVEKGLKDATKGFPWFRAAVLLPLVNAECGLLRPPADTPTPTASTTFPPSSSTVSALSSLSSGRVCSPDAVRALTAGWAPLLLRLTALHPSLGALLLEQLLRCATEAASAALSSEASADDASAIGDSSANGVVAVRAMSWARLLISRHWHALAAAAASGGGGNSGGNWALAVMPSSAPSSSATASSAAAPTLTFLLSKPSWSPKQAAWMAAPAPASILCGLSQAFKKPLPQSKAQKVANMKAVATGSTRSGSGNNSGGHWQHPSLSVDAAIYPTVLSSLRSALCEPALARSATLQQIASLAADCGVDVDAVRADAAACMLALSTVPAVDTAAYSSAVAEEEEVNSSSAGPPDAALIAAVATANSATAIVDHSFQQQSQQKVQATTTTVTTMMMDLDALEALLGDEGGDSAARANNGAVHLSSAPSAQPATVGGAALPPAATAPAPAQPAEAAAIASFASSARSPAADAAGWRIRSGSRPRWTLGGL